jgi:sec-independent protein translocase protein TatB
MEDEFRAMEQAEQQQKIAAIEAAAPVAPLNIPEPEHPHLPAPMPVEPQPGAVAEAASATLAATATLEPIPIASNGDLHLMPPASGLPVGRSNFANGSTGSGSLGGLFDTIPHTADPVAMTAPAETEASTHG